VIKCLHLDLTGQVEQKRVEEANEERRVSLLVVQLKVETLSQQQKRHGDVLALDENRGAFPSCAS
jgi:hypothetical protein